MAGALLAAAPEPGGPEEQASPEEEAERAEPEVEEGAVEPEPGEPPVAEAPAVPAVPGHPYQAIILRNSFGLREPPPPAAPPPPEAAPPVNTTALKLTGITTLLGKRAMFVFNDGKTNKVSDLVREGERDRVITDLEVVAIDAAARTVKVVFGGKEMQLDFVNHGLMPPTNVVAVAAAGRPAGVVPPTLPGQRPGTVGGVAPQLGGAPATMSTTRAFPTRPTRLGGAGNPVPTMGGVGNTLIAGPNVAPVDDPGAFVPSLTPEQQTLVLREQHEVARQMNIEFPPLPPAPGLEDLSPPVPQPGEFPQLPGQPPALPAFPQPHRLR